MRVLIVGSTTKEYAFAKKISESKNVDLLLVAGGNAQTAEIATNVDIDCNNVEEILDFVTANEINLTITFDKTLIDKGIADAFNEANLMIFAPVKDAARIVSLKSAGKKFMYKTKINTPKFAVVDKESSGIDYLKNVKYPIVIKNDSDKSKVAPIVCNNFAQAKRILGLKFLVENEKILIEEFVEGKEYSAYFITDGYNAIPICVSVPYKYSLENNGGAITNGMGAYAPAQSFDKEMIERVKHTIIQPALMELARNDNAYIGILGVDIIVDPYDRIHVLEFTSSFNEPDCQSILSILKSDFPTLANAAIVGSLADDFNEIEIADEVAVSAVLTSPNYKKTNLNNPIIEGLDELENIDISFDEVKKNEYLEYETTGKRNLILTSKAKTLSAAREQLYNNIDLINYRDKKYLKDIGKFRIKD